MLFVMVIFSFLLVQNPLTSRYIAMVKHQAIEVDKKDHSLHDRILKAAQTYNAKPQDAKLDRVWKTIPGYNGIEVDIEASYKKMKKDNRFDEKKLVFKQTKPNVHLRDLPPSPIYRGHPEKPMISFAINVAWGNEYLPEMLSTLKKHQVHATFFLEGRWTKENPDLAQMIVDGHHEVGNHSYSHPDMSILSNEKIRKQLTETNNVIEATTKNKVSLFAPPSGSYREDVVKIAHSLNMYTIMWTIDTIDWKKPNPDVLIQRVTSKIHPGAIILMHPTESTSKSLDTLIKEIKGKNYKLDTVSELLEEERIFPMKDEKNDKQ
nr:polysaccharide deacetylase family protein [Oikeobacillus pervagus]